jgi:hypothetical protein
VTGRGQHEAGSEPTTHLALAGGLVRQLQEAGQVALHLLGGDALAQDQPIEAEEDALGERKAGC